MAGLTCRIVRSVAMMVPWVNDELDQEVYREVSALASMVISPGAVAVLSP